MDNQFITIVDLWNETRSIVDEISTVQYERLVDLVNLREQLLIELQSEMKLSMEEQNLLNDLKNYDEFIMSRMQQLKDEAEMGLAKFHQSRQQKQIYEKSYIAESMFYDKTK